MLLLEFETVIPRAGQKRLQRGETLSIQRIKSQSCNLFAVIV